ncbi:glycosyltransferase [Longilinea arvoryzae]|uniref:Glycosyltransferase n=1 Tax=Longilinea arvoryzae TaxID=360412 RepID=A0A0S7BPR1_9CHLR|nr:glycosyltransferase [Longilinea arvoryzae]GAP15834.1 glycosyltransferase [Longilinea arvoryzae]
MRITLCILTRNEIIGCKHDIPLLHKEAFDEIFAIDGNSTDGTIEYLTELGIPVYIQPRKGLNAACVYAFEKCNTDALIFFHPKGSVPVSDTENFRFLFEQGYDLVIASRNIKGGKNEEDNKIIRYRKWFVTFLALASAVFFRREGPIVWDVLHGFRGMTVRCFTQINPSAEGVSIDLEMVCRSYKKRLKRIEFPTTESPRLAGTSNFKALPTGWKLLKYLLTEIMKGD